MCVELGNSLGAKERKTLMSEARGYAEEALAISDECVAEADLNAAESRRVLAKVCLSDGQLPEAIKHFEHATALLVKIYGADAFQLAEIYEDLAWARLRLHHATHGFRNTEALAPRADVLHAAPVPDSGDASRGPSLSPPTTTPSPTHAGLLPKIGTTPSAVGGDGGGESTGGRSRVAHDGSADAVATSADAGGARSRPADIPSLDNGDGDSDDSEEEIDEAAQDALHLLQHARAIRLAKQGSEHFELGLCLVKLAEFYWFVDQYDKVLELYLEAIRILTAFAGEKSKYVVHLLSWVVIARTLDSGGTTKEAIKANDRALILAKAVFGEMSWEVWRVMSDKVHLIQHSVDPSLSAQSGEARKAYSMAERVETHAAILLDSLQKEKAEDERLSELSAFAPLKREAMLRPEEGDAPAPRRRGKRTKEVASKDCLPALNTATSRKKAHPGGQGAGGSAPKMKRSVTKPETSISGTVVPSLRREKTTDNAGSKATRSPSP
jgi:tetratricopeptide (TPR) repeat protein